MPKVSIIVPNYNHARYLPKRLDSIFNQTYQDFEVILLDDCSTDNSVEILRQYTDHPKVSHFTINEQNSGSPFKQWEKGVNLARGEYVWIAESDDYANPLLLEGLVKILDSDPELGIAYCQSLRVDDHDNVIDCYKDLLKNSHNKWDRDYRNSGINEVKEKLIWRNTIPNASAVLTRRKTLLEVVVMSENMRMTGDWQIYISILKDRDIYFLHKPLNYHRLHPGITRIHNTKDKKISRFQEEAVILKYIFIFFSVESELRKEVLDAFFGRLISWFTLKDILNYNTWSLLYASLENDRLLLYKVSKFVVSKLSSKIKSYLKAIIKTI